MIIIMGWNNEENEDEDELDPDELRRQVSASLNYLIKEGMVVKIGDRYRLKTQEELRKELEDIENDNN
jgi:uncharacterized Fe-S cluster-containing radical SAM superfamily protein